MTTTTLYKASERTVRKACRTCGATDLYWANVGSPTSKDVVLVDANSFTRALRKGDLVFGSDVHSCHIDRLAKLTSGEPVDSEATDEAPAPAPVAAPVSPAPAPADDDAAQLARLLARLAGGPQVDEAAVRDMIKSELANVIFPTTTVVERASGELRKTEGLAHFMVASIARTMLTGERGHCMLVGPAGSGKSSAAHQAADLVGLPFYTISLSPQTSESKLMGYMDATGNYVPGVAREPYEHGGVLCLDELDNGHPSILAVMNALLSNGVAGFPDGTVKRHPDFRVIGTANTYGRGADRRYVGRQALDAATLDRFRVKDFPYDVALEDALCMGTGLDAGKVRDILKYVRKCRENIDTHKLALCITPRGAMGVCEELAAGASWAEAAGECLRKGASDQDWAKITSGVSAPVWVA